MQVLKGVFFFLALLRMTFVDFSFSAFWKILFFFFFPRPLKQFLANPSFWEEVLLVFVKDDGVFIPCGLTKGF